MNSDSTSWVFEGLAEKRSEGAGHGGGNMKPAIIHQREEELMKMI